MPASDYSLPSRSLPSSGADRYTSKVKKDHIYIRDGGEGSWEEVNVIFKEEIMP